MGEEERAAKVRREAAAGHVARVLCFLLEMERSAPRTMWASHQIEEVVQSFGVLTGINLDEARRRLL